jgi:hypothetical protein
MLFALAPIRTPPLTPAKQRGRWVVTVPLNLLVPVLMQVGIFIGIPVFASYALLLSVTWCARWT